MPLKDFSCDKHGVFEAVVDSEAKNHPCPSCNSESPRIFTKAPSLTGEVRHSFNPHYDIQLGAWFESAEHKKNYLAKTGRSQLSGPLSPRESVKGNVVCNLKQAKTHLSPHIKT